jgi:hypothetical protein
MPRSTSRPHHSPIDNLSIASFHLSVFMFEPEKSAQIDENALRRKLQLPLQQQVLPGEIS